MLQKIWIFYNLNVLRNYFDSSTNLFFWFIFS